ncbi:MAG: Crp/Fnr family transcriptional regulator [Patescibacteria group bacterium]
MEESSRIAKRLGKIWEPADFTQLFEKFGKRTPLKIKKGNTILYQGDIPDRLYFIKKGYIKLYRLSEDGKDPITYLYGPGSIVGIRALTSQDKELKHNAEALTDVEIVTIPRGEYIDIISENPEYLLDLLNVFIDRLNYSEQKIEGFVTKDATSRIANFLYYVANRFGEKNGKTITIPIPLTHQLVAEFVGSARETVTIALNKLEKEKIIKAQRGQIIISNIKKLNSYSKLIKII